MQKENKKQVIGLLGEMNLSMELHERGWQVHKSYIDEGIDFMITKYYCSNCKKANIKLINRAIQVKTSEGINGNYSFHPKIRYDMNGRIFYVWIAVINKSNLHYYIFNTKDVEKFDDLRIDTYQITDNQKTSLRINENGKILNKGKKYDYDCFADFHNNFDCLEKLIQSDCIK